LRARDRGMLEIRLGKEKQARKTSLKRMRGVRKEGETTSSIFKSAGCAQLPTQYCQREVTEAARQRDILAARSKGALAGRALSSIREKDLVMERRSSTA